MVFEFSLQPACKKINLSHFISVQNEMQKVSSDAAINQTQQNFPHGAPQGIEQ